MSGVFLDRRTDPRERGIVVMPARIHRDDVRLTFAQRTGGAGPAAQFDISGVVQLGFVETDQRFQIAGPQTLDTLYRGVLP